MTLNQIQDLMLVSTMRSLKRTMGAEMNLPQGYSSGKLKPPSNSMRVTASGKTIMTEHGTVRVDLRRYQNSSFAPTLTTQRQFSADSKTGNQAKKGKSHAV